MNATQLAATKVTLPRFIFLATLWPSAALSLLGCDTLWRKATAPESEVEAGGKDDATQRPRVVAIADVDGNAEALLSLLEQSNLVDATGRWTGKNAIFVQLGNASAKGAGDKQVMELLQALQSEAESAGGRVAALLGPDETDAMSGQFGGLGTSTAYSDEAARLAAFSASGEHGRWLRALGAVVQVGDTVLSHAGADPSAAKLGVTPLNEAIQAALAAQVASPWLGKDGPLRFEGYRATDEKEVCTLLSTALDRLEARRMVVSHSSQDQGAVKSRCDGRLWAVDSGLRSGNPGVYTALGIVGGQTGPLVRTGRDAPPTSWGDAASPEPLPSPTANTPAP
jgi:hypothetical protein